MGGDRRLTETVVNMIGASLKHLKSLSIRASTL